MVERVARAIALCQADGDPSTNGMFDAFDAGEDMSMVVTAEDWRVMARAAIEAMREPTEAMLDAVHAGARDKYGCETAELYTALIDAALK